MAVSAERTLELMRLKMPELVQIGQGLGLKISLKAPKVNAVKRIIRAQDLAAERGGAPVQAGPEQPQNPAFEAIAQADTSGGPVPAEEGEAPSGRGGARPGAGRPLGMTSEKARMANLPQMSNPAVRGALQLAFALWAQQQGVKDLALTEPEAERLALPYTQLLAYFGYDEYIPPWAMLGVTAVWTTWEVVAGRIALLQKLRSGGASGPGAASREMVQPDGGGPEQNRDVKPILGSPVLTQN